MKSLIKNKHWYIVVVKNKKPILYYKAFKTKESIKSFMDINNIKGFNFLVIKGEQALEYNIKIKTRAFNVLFRHTEPLVKYRYPVDRFTKQDKKSFRTKSRRWYRDYKQLPNKYTDFKY